MRIAFFGAFTSFDYFQIGGIESFARRLATALLKDGHQADFVVYGSPTSQSRIVGPGIGLYYFTNFRDACAALLKGYEHVLTLQICASDRLQYLRFRRLNGSMVRFHKIYCGWPDSLLKRKVGFLDARLFPFNGRVFCISPRLFNDVHRWSDRAVLLVPPVSEQYFLSPGDKPTHDKLRLTYIGRTESGKGIEEVISLFTKLKDSPGLHCKIHGFHHRNLQASVQIHGWLQHQKGISYSYTPFESYCQEVEDNLIRILKDTDILLLPYRKLSSTIDTPMLLLEGMASLCAVITPAEGSIPNIYGSSPFLFTEKQDVAAIINLAQASPKHLADERQRIFGRNAELGFQATRVAARLLEAIA
jgi:glycosyltransferase involved in cell wall biosynthesis